MTTSIHQINGVDIKIHPNPVEDLLFVSQTGLNRGIIKLLDLNGKLILTKDLNKDNTIEMQHVPAGVYMFWISTQELILVEKVVKL